MDPIRYRPILRTALWRATRNRHSFAHRQHGRWGWLVPVGIGLPTAILLLVFMMKGCT